ncbi:MAG: iron ABC transporter permease [Actinobacteria bacterium]|nr:iron ABC transporter permease [Actinomycetota bacterium]
MARELAGSGTVTTAPYVRTARRFVIVPVAFVAVFTVWPTLVTLRRGFDVTSVLTDPGLRATVWFTTWQALLSTIVALALGLPATWVLARHDFAARRIVRALTLVPFVLPTLVVGLAFRALLPGDLRTGALPLVVAHAFLNVAVVVRIVGTRWESQPFTYDEAAATLGAGPISRFATVTWPLLRGSITAAAGLVFMYCFSTYGAARVLAGPTRPVVETEIYRFAVLAGDMRAASALAVAQVVIVAVVLALTSRYLSWYRQLCWVSDSSSPSVTDRSIGAASGGCCRSLTRWSQFLWSRAGSHHRCARSPTTCAAPPQPSEHRRRAFSRASMSHFCVDRSAQQAPSLLSSPLVSSGHRVCCHAVETKPSR